MTRDPLRLLYEIASDMRSNASLMDELAFTPEVAREFARQQATAIATCAEILAACYAASTRYPQPGVDALTAEQFGLRPKEKL